MAKFEFKKFVKKDESNAAPIASVAASPDVSTPLGDDSPAVQPAADVAPEPVRKGLGFLNRPNATAAVVKPVTTIEGKINAAIKADSPAAATKTEEVKALATLAKPNFLGKAVAVSKADSVSTLDLPTEAEVIPPGPEGFQWKLDRLNALIEKDHDISPIIHDMVKNRIRSVFEELKEFPEYDGLIIERDAHNIMLFFQHSMSVAKDNIGLKETKRTATATKQAAAKKIDFGDLDAGLEDFTLGSLPTSLEALGSMDTDSIETLDKRKKK